MAGTQLQTMRQYIIIFLFAFDLGLAQNNLGYGLQIGGNYTSEAIVNNSIGFYAGGFSQIGITDKLDIRVEALYSKYESKKMFSQVELDLGAGQS